MQQRKVADSLKYKTLKGRTVYGGGGIIPDIFVPLQGKHGDEALEMLMQSGVISYFVFEQIDKSRTEFEGISFETFYKKAETTDLYVQLFQDYLKSSGVNFSLSSHKAMVKHYIIAEFARQLFDEEKYFEIRLKKDSMILEVLKQ